MRRSKLDGETASLWRWTRWAMLRGKHTKLCHGANTRITGDLVVMDTMSYFYRMPVLPLYPHYHTSKLGMPLPPIPSAPGSPNPSFSLFAPSLLPAGLLAGWLEDNKCLYLWFLLHCDVRVGGMRTNQVTHTETHLSTDKSVWLKKFSWCYRSKYTNTGQVHFTQI